MSESRVCSNGCGRAFYPPEKDPDRTMCQNCLRELGLPRTNAPEPLPTGACSQCGETYVNTAGDPRCSTCRAIVHTEDDETPVPHLEVLEVDARPAPTRDGLPLFRRLSKQQNLDYAAELAADMETGYYIPEGKTEPWPERRFNIAEILRRMGYSPSYVANSQRPAWWPEAGTQAFKGYVDWKVRERAMLGRVTYEKLTPYIEALTFMGFAEMARRIKLEPDKVAFRDLAQFTMRGVEVIKGAADPWKGAMTGEGADAYERIGKAIEGVGDATAANAIRAMLDAILVQARERTRETVAIAAKTA